MSSEGRSGKLCGKGYPPYVDSVLTPREKRVLQLRHGLIDGHARPLDQVAKRFGVSPGRVAQIEAAALKKLRDLGPDADLRDQMR